MRLKLLLSTFIKLILGLIIVAALIFIPAGTICFFNGWMLIVALFLPMTVIGVVLMIMNPELLRKRMNSKEKLNSQNRIVIISALMFAFGFVVAGLDFRFSWSAVPNSVVIISILVFLFHIFFMVWLSGKTPFFLVLSNFRIIKKLLIQECIQL